MWHGLWPDRAVEDVPITHVTNGVHHPTWLGGPMRALLDRHLGEDWPARADDPATWTPVREISDADLWAVRTEQRRDLIAMVRERSVIERLARGEGKEYAHSAAERLDENALTIGFARRLATYKRLDLLLADPDRMLALLGAEDRPVQLLVAGKAHPKDDGGKRLVTRLFEYRYHPQFAGRVMFLDDYDIGARRDARPRLRRVGQRPAPAAGGVRHVGMKNAVNGGLQLSVLDGWWPEAYDGTNGWAISGDVDDDHGAQDHRHAQDFYRLLGDEVVPDVLRRRATAPARPHAWLQMVRASLATCGPKFGATRMVSDYVTRMYPGR